MKYALTIGGLAALLQACAFQTTTQLPAFAQYCSTANAAKYKPMAEAAAREAGAPVSLFVRIVAHESCFNPAARGAAGEWGLGQIKCATARGIGFEGSCSWLADANTNLKWSAKYLAIGYKKCGNEPGAAFLYNAGQYSSCSGRNAYTKKVTGK
jgi:soluble lytic murein transglycosylase-like protein